MIPSVLSNQIRKGVEDFLRTTFPVSTPFFHGIIDRLIDNPEAIFKGPYISIKLPYRSGNIGTDFFQNIPLGFVPYLHQEKAFKRMTGDNGKSTIIATGTRSGKTECFMYPILDYCYRHRGENGIKAIIIYPMNALATDQAKRFAREIYKNLNLRGKITAGLFIGQKEDNPSMSMTAESIITHRDTLRFTPPDILLTNYKMLDYLMIRPRDFPLWRENRPETLKYLVVDELHTFDGAQGTDLACLIRRLKERLKTPENYLCCIGTSATLGGEEDFEDLCNYASAVFGDSFDEDAVVTESLLTPEEFFAESPISRTNKIPPEQAAALNPFNYSDYPSYFKAQHELWFSEKLDDFEKDDWKIQLSDLLKGHAFFRNLMTILNNRAVPVNEVNQTFDQIVPDFAMGTPEYKNNLINSMIALISCARLQNNNDLHAFLNVRFQLWFRELRRIVGDVKKEPDLKFSDDLKDEQMKVHLPIIHCRECGSMGWAGTKRQHDNFINPDLQHFYLCFFNYNPTVTFVFPQEGIMAVESQLEFGQTFCGNCLHFTDGNNISSCQSCGKTEKLIPVVVINPRVTRNNILQGNHNCPFCDSYNSLTILGSRASSLTSVVISQLYSSPFNEDKKLLTFSDSVQDASHRAGFFAGRTYRFNFRTAIQHFMNHQGGGLALSQVPSAFISHWSKEMSQNEFIATFLAPDMEWLADYEYLLKNKELPEDSDLLDFVHKRIDWEITSEYSFNCRIGRTLEKTSSSITSPDSQKIHQVVDELTESLGNEIGGLKNIDLMTVYRLISGILMQLKNKGAVFNQSLKSYINGWGGYFKINIIPYMPRFGKHSRTPSFLTTKRGTRFDTLLGYGAGSKTWYQEWVEKILQSLAPNISAYVEDIFAIIIPALVKHKILREERIQGHPIWSINPSTMLISLDVNQYRCDTCGHNVSVSHNEASCWQDNTCLRFKCTGHYQLEPPREDYYGRLYATGDVQRIFSEEHTSLLKRETRENLEKEFMHGKDPWSPNLLSCTPTLELGIDIGELSSVILCSVPPAESNYLQRQGRSGRKNGNAFNVTVANARPHDLYFYHDPLEMISGKINPPGCFLNAPAVLERQFTAFCFDRWVETGIDAAAIPNSLGDVLSDLNRKGKRITFPHNLLDYIENNRTLLFDRFIRMFKEQLIEKSVETLRIFVEGTEEGQESLRYRIIDALTNMFKEKQALQNKVKKLTAMIKQKEEHPARDRNFEDEINDLKIEKASLNEIIHFINQKNVFNFFTDEGLLPNYAFPEAGVTLRSIIYRKKKKGDSHGIYDTKLFEYERPAMSAIHELAPSNRFYAEGRRVMIDQVDMNLSEIEEWRFCNCCPHLEKVSIGEEKSPCSMCGSALWQDEGQKRHMLRMRQVIATTSDRDSRSTDDSDDREPEFYNKHMLVDIDKKHREIAYKIDDDSLPFGFEFLRKTTFREINFGKKEAIAETIQIAGYEVPQNGFSVCTECGKVQTDKDEIKHAMTCKKKGSKSSKNLMDFLYLYREYSSEAIRILLPMTSFAGSTEKLHSFIAAIFLGLKKQFKGKIDHLQSTVYEEPIPNTIYRKKYLVLYDLVPGGTGYLKELMISEKPLMDVFTKALETLKSCPCSNDPEKDGCYHCLYAYRNSYEMADISRETAIRLLTDIVSKKDLLVKTETLDKIPLNALFESELEARFIEALRRLKVNNQPVSLKRDVVNGKPGWFLKVSHAGYYIEPQVELGQKDGVSIPSKADFVFYPERSGNGTPIAVFTDGFMYHADPAINKPRVGKDMAQRMAIVRSGKYLIWSVSWDDVENKFSTQNAHFENFTNNNIPLLSKFLDAYHDQFHVKKLSAVHNLDSFDMFIHLLSNPATVMWKMYAYILSMLHLDPKIQHSKKAVDNVIASLLENIEWKQVVLDLHAEATGDYLCGKYQKNYENEYPKIKLVTYIEKQSFQNNEFAEFKVVCRLFDDLDIAVHPSFKSVWNGFIRMFNIYQFVKNALFVTSQGIANGEYLGLKPEVTSDVLREAHITANLNELMEITDPSVHPLLFIIAKKNLQLPEAGFELSNDRGIVIGNAELAWPDQKIAFLLEEEMAYEKAFLSDGWQIVKLQDAIDDPEKYVSLIKKD